MLVGNRREKARRNRGERGPTLPGPTTESSPFEDPILPLSSPPDFSPRWTVANPKPTTHRCATSTYPNNPDPPILLLFLLLLLQGSCFHRASVWCTRAPHSTTRAVRLCSCPPKINEPRAWHGSNQPSFSTTLLSEGI